MSNDSHQPEPGKGKTPPKPSKSSGEPTETDLWDLDQAPTRKTPEPPKTDTLPTRRTSVSESRPKRPNEVGGRKAQVSPAGKPAAKRPSMERKSGSEAKAQAESAPEGGDDDKPSARGEDAARPFSGSLTKVEKISIIALFAALVIGAALTIIHFSNRVPTRSPLSEETDFPVSGELIEVTSAETYWRKPVTTGEDADVVRRGTVLIPVAKLKLNSKPGAIRVFFRNEEGTVIGDGISRDVSGEQELVIAATAGFDDLGMHAAYRTGEKEPWVVQIFEGRDSGGDREAFRKVLEMEISTDRR